MPWWFWVAAVPLVGLAICGALVFGWALCAAAGRDDERMGRK